MFAFEGRPLDGHLTNQSYLTEEDILLRCKWTLENPHSVSLRFSDWSASSVQLSHKYCPFSSPLTIRYSFALAVSLVSCSVCHDIENLDCINTQFLSKGLIDVTPSTATCVCELSCRQLILVQRIDCCMAYTLNATWYMPHVEGQLPSQYVENFQLSIQGGNVDGHGAQTLFSSRTGTDFQVKFFLG